MVPALAMMDTVTNSAVAVVLVAGRDVPRRGGDLTQGSGPISIGLQAPISIRSAWAPRVTPRGACPVAWELRDT